MAHFRSISCLVLIIASAGGVAGADDDFLEVILPAKPATTAGPHTPVTLAQASTPGAPTPVAPVDAPALPKPDDRVEGLSEVERLRRQIACNRSRSIP